MNDMIVAINIDEIKARKNNPPAGNIRIDNKTRIDNVEEIRVPLFPEDVTKISYVFQTTYNTEKEHIGEIEIRGHVVFRGQREVIHTEWTNNKKLPEEMGLPVMNSILRRCISKAIGISEDLMLPPPVSLPLMQPSKQKKEQNVTYIG